MKYKCSNCGTINEVAAGKDSTRFVCYSCKTPLPSKPESEGETSAVVGLIGGAALGASIAGPVGAIIGGILGGIIGKESKGVG
jgi:DNA-directed RNA polymerase subunit RPC12/RpoP